MSNARGMLHSNAMVPESAQYGAPQALLTRRDGA
jgi:hypothetical protein